MPDVFEWRQSPPQETLVQAIQRLAEGKLVAFPTDTCYIVAASAVLPDAVRRLVELAPVDTDMASVEVAVSGIEQALDWVPDMPTLAQRLARRAWPGPLTLALPRSAQRSAADYLPEEVGRLLARHAHLQMRAPCHAAILQILEHLPGPVLMCPLRRDDGSEVTSADEAVRAAPTALDLVILDGNAYFGQPASLVEVTPTGWKLIRPGVITEEDLRRLTSCLIVFVCTGNTCRSPLAEALCRKMLADHLGCTQDELPARGYIVQSAGLSAVPGYPASPEAVVIAGELGADLSSHRSQPLTAELLIQADHVLTMTASHLDALLPHGQAMLLPPRLLSCDGEDVTDPIGAEPDVYRECARQILHHLQRRLPEFQLY